MIKNSKSNALPIACMSCIGMGMFNSAYSMGLRSFVALPVEKHGTIIRLSFEYAEDNNTDTLTTNIAYGINAKRTLLFGLPFRLSPSGSNKLGDISILYRYLVLQKDLFSGTDRLALLGGLVIPTNSNSDSAIQAGLVFTHFKNRHEIDIDVLYQAGIDDRSDSGRYDISWQYRLLPNEHPDWGIAKAWNSVLELNGRWNKGNNITHQITVGLQRIHQKWVIEAGLTKAFNNEKALSYILSTRFHF